MKKAPFNNFLGRKTQSLFDTNIEIKEMDNVELVLDCSAIPESGTAKVRARPTVKHFILNTSSSDIVQGFAVPTPKVPVLPPVNGPKTNGTDEKLSNGVSIPDFVEEEIFIPPPPSMAPPPPPPKFTPPPPEFSFDPISSPQAQDLASLQPPSMPPPKPPSKPPSPLPTQESDLSSLKPPPMAPPKPPSDPSSAKVSGPISSPLTNSPNLTECPKFTPPKPPASAERPQITPPRAQKVPPPKPTRLSSIPSQDSLPLTPAPALPAPVPTPSTFNPQNTAKLYSVPKASLLSRELDLEKPSKTILLLQDTSTDSIPVQANGKVPSDNKDLGSAKAQVPPTKPTRRNSSGIQLEKDLQDLENVQFTLPGEVVKVQGDVAVDPPQLPTAKDLNKPTQPSPKASPKLEKVPAASETSLVTPHVDSPGRSRKHIPYVSRNPYLRRTNESSVAGGTSPMALLLAAKEREKQRSSLSRENSAKRNSYSEPTTVSIHQSQSMPNSFTVIPRSTSSPSLGEQEDIQNEPNVQSSESPASTSPSRPTSSSSLVAELLEKHDTEAAPTASDASYVKDEENGEELCIPFIPPPPEFANSDTEEENSQDHPEPPPSFPPPDPPSKKVSSPSPTPPCQPPRGTGPATPPKPKAAKPPSPPKLPSQKAKVKAKPLGQDKPKPATPPPASSLSSSQATLQSILQKKMMEMDQKHSFQEVNTNNDDWGSPLSDEESSIPVRPSPLPKNKNIPTALSAPPSQAPGLDMSELEKKVAKKAQVLSSAAKSATSNGPQSKQSYGMTFTVRPGSKQPITPVIKGDAP
ncbi:hypothetical protein AAFF_G00142970 [Aldrovandia affinis]|uniref:Uncharacterized protein n=1 Tax=Aldrovandia affinis TaxID=143900 RepID=A0AAD7T0J3_9TELE|nr:hypothetical protein AAFF_G00142970 [Aldrovandia affinis]